MIDKQVTDTIQVIIHYKYGGIVLASRHKNQIKLDKQKREAMIEIIKTYFSNERDEDLGDLGAALVLDFIIEKLAPEFYNQGVQEAYQYFNERVEEVLGIQK